MKLQSKIILYMTVILVIVIGAVGIFSIMQAKDSLENQMRDSAMDLAATIASMEGIGKDLANEEDYSKIQDKIEAFREKTRFQYIIVMDMEGIQYSYPYEDGLGKQYREGGEETVLKYGKPHVAADTNTLISAIRAFYPIYYDNEQVGAVLVGLLTDSVYKETNTHIKNLKIILCMGTLIGIIGAALLSFNIKKVIFGLEPKEIALLVGQKDLVIQSLEYGIIATDEKGKLILYNKGAKEVFNVDKSNIGKSISNFSPKYEDEIMNVLINKKSLYNREIKVCPGKSLLCSHTLLRDHKENIIGVVSTFKDLTEVKQMAEELTGFKKMANALRAQSHEFMNKLHTISGLIQLEEYDEALEYVSFISEEKNEIEHVIGKIKNPKLAAILLAKYCKAAELKIDFVIDGDSYVNHIPKDMTEDEICSIIGNLIENSIDELVEREDGKIEVKINSTKNMFNIRVRDNGRGIDERIRNKVFDHGVTTKTYGNGIGLSIVKEIIDNVEGHIDFKIDDGTIWDISIPIERST